MKLNRFIVLSVLAGICQGICFAAAVPIAPSPMEESRIVPPPQSSDVTFPHSQAKILIYTENPQFGDNLGEYLRDDAIRAQLARTLNVTLTHGVSFINNENQFNDEMASKNQPERIFFASGAKVTKSLLTYLNKLNTLNLINSVILFDPSIPSDSYFLGAQLIPNYHAITNRVYNFYNKASKGFWRKIFPARQGELPMLYGNLYYFQGINICAQVINEKGTVTDANFNFETIDKARFRKIIEAIVKANKYRLQPDLNGIIQNNTVETTREASMYPLRKVSDRDLPIVSIRDKILYDDNPPAIHAMIVYYTGSTAAGTKTEYKCDIPRYLAPWFKDTLQKEEELSAYVNQIFATKETKVEDVLQGYAMVKQNPYTLEKFAEREGELVDKVDTSIEICRMERDYIEKRKLIVLDTLQKLCHGPANYINIAIIASGGGSREVFATYGALKGLQALGVLASTTYICGLSGSTWAIASLFIEVNKLSAPNVFVRDSLINASSKSAQRVHDFGFVTEAILKAPLHYFESYPTTLKVKSLLNQPITNTDYYGCGIVKTCSVEKKFITKIINSEYLSSQLGEAARWQRKRYRIPESYVPRLPFPIYTAVMPLCNYPAPFFPGLNSPLIK